MTELPPPAAGEASPPPRRPSPPPLGVLDQFLPSRVLGAAAEEVTPGFRPLVDPNRAA